MKKITFDQFTFQSLFTIGGTERRVVVTTRPVVFITKRAWRAARIATLFPDPYVRGTDTKGGAGSDTEGGVLGAQLWLAPWTSIWAGRWRVDLWNRKIQVHSRQSGEMERVQSVD
jgi:hypothetical protein